MTQNQAVKSSICNPKYVTKDLLKLPDNVSITCDDGEVRANVELLSVRSDFFARGFNNPAFMESQNKSLRMAGCSKAAMEAVKAYLRGDINVCYLVRGGPSSFGFFSRKSVGSRKF